jgi:uncharacterized SAM-binding protein YcdF (DUF218 family)
VADPSEGAGGRVVAVLGYSTRRSPGLHPICAERVARAEGLARAGMPVILSGWARHPRGESEAELMRAAWQGPAVPLVCDPDASSTAGNAANVAAAALRLGAEEVVVVTSRWHAVRAGILVRAALRGSGVRVSVETAPGRRSAALLGRELGCLVLLPAQLPGVRRRARRRLA